MEFCGGCHDEAVTAWSNGEAHEVPKFGDGAQRNAAIARRQRVVNALIRENDQEALSAFPEWKGMLEGFGLPANSQISEMLARMTPPLRMGRSTRRSRQIHRSRVRMFYRTDGDRKQLVARLGLKMAIAAA